MGYCQGGGNGRMRGREDCDDNGTDGDDGDVVWGVSSSSGGGGGGGGWRRIVPAAELEAPLWSSFRL